MRNAFPMVTAPVSLSASFPQHRLGLVRPRRLPNVNGKRFGNAVLAAVVGTAFHFSARHVASPSRLRPAGRRQCQKPRVPVFLCSLRFLAQPHQMSSFSPNVADGDISAKWGGRNKLVCSTALGWRDVHRLHLRVYGPEDYLQRLRAVRCRCAGFSSIPEPASVPAATAWNSS